MAVKIRATLASLRQPREEKDYFIEDLNRDWLENNLEYRAEMIERYEAISGEMAQIADDLQATEYSKMPKPLKKLHDMVCEGLNAKLVARSDILCGLHEP